MAKLYFRLIPKNWDAGLPKELLKSAVKWFGRGRRKYSKKYGEAVKFSQLPRNHNCLCVQRPVVIVWTVLWLVEWATRVFRLILWYIVSRLRRGWLSKTMLLILMGEGRGGGMKRSYRSSKLLPKWQYRTLGKANIWRKLSAMMLLIFCSGR